jgi:hypothetical protein
LRIPVTDGIAEIGPDSPGQGLVTQDPLAVGEGLLVQGDRLVQPPAPRATISHRPERGHTVAHSELTGQTASVQTRLRTERHPLTIRVVSKPGGLIRRIERTNRYVLTPDGIKTAVFYTKLHNRLLRPLLAADQPQAPAELRAALRAIDQHINTYITCARISQAAWKLDTNVQKLETKDR